MYDLAVLLPVTPQPALPRAPKSIVVVNTAALLIDDTGATWVDLFDRTMKSEAVAPGNGFTFGQVAGGDVVRSGTSGADQYVVGATRAGAPTNWILHVGGAGNLSAFTLTTARTGAAAGVLPGGLYVSGGTVEGSTAGGNVESCSTTQCPGNPSTLLPDAPDPFANHAIVDGVLPFAVTNPGMTAPPPNPDGTPATTPVAFLVGGASGAGEAGGIRTFNLNCTTPMDCTISPPRATLPALTRTRAFFLGPSTSPQLLVVGETSDGENHAFLADPLTDPIAPTEIALRERRKGASVALFPSGLVGVVGGTDATTGAAIKSFELFALP